MTAISGRGRMIALVAPTPKHSPARPSMLRYPIPDGTPRQPDEPFRTDMSIRVDGGLLGGRKSVAFRALERPTTGLVIEDPPGMRQRWWQLDGGSQPKPPAAVIDTAAALGQSVLGAKVALAPFAGGEWVSKGLNVSIIERGLHGGILASESYHVPASKLGDGSLRGIVNGVDQVIADLTHTTKPFKRPLFAFPARP